MLSAAAPDAGSSGDRGRRRADLDRSAVLTDLNPQPGESPATVSTSSPRGTRSERLQPGLALSWKPLDDTTWEFSSGPASNSMTAAADARGQYLFDRPRRQGAEQPSALSIYTKSVKEIIVARSLDHPHQDGPSPIRCLVGGSLEHSPSSRRRRPGARRPTISTRVRRRSAPAVQIRRMGSRATAVVFTRNDA